MASYTLIRNAIKRMLLEQPNLSNRAIARATGTSPHTVARLRPTPPLNRFEADGRRARGRKPHTIRPDPGGYPDISDWLARGSTAAALPRFAPTPPFARPAAPSGPSTVPSPAGLIRRPTGRVMV
jgi:hypothetical protein